MAISPQNGWLDALRSSGESPYRVLGFVRRRKRKEGGKEGREGSQVLQGSQLEFTSSGKAGEPERADEQRERARLILGCGRIGRKSKNRESRFVTVMGTRGGDSSL